MIGNFYRNGQLYTQERIHVNDHDFRSLADGMDGKANDTNVTNHHPSPTNHDTPTLQTGDRSPPVVHTVAYASIGDGKRRGPRVPVMAGTGPDETWLAQQRPLLSQRDRLDIISRS